jgi:predicted nucleotidyltransferase/biotin operon repressor
MKIVNPLDKILDNEAKVRILRFLIKTNAQWNGRQIAREINVTPATAHKALQGLHKEGVLILRNVGKTHVYNLNEDNYLVSDLLWPLFAKEEKTLSSIINMIRRKIEASEVKKHISSVLLFGSVNLHKDRPTSDIDLAVVIKDEKSRKDAEALFEGIDKKVSSEFGNTVSPYINTEAEFRTKHKKGLGVIKNILKSHRLLYGKEIKALL